MSKIKKEHYVNNNKFNKELCVKTKIIEKDSLAEHLMKVNNNKNNKNILKPDTFIPYNINDNYQYNILNNFGIKNNKERYKFEKTIHNILPINGNSVFKNYNKQFSSEKKLKENSLCKKEEINCHERLKILGRYTKNYYNINMSYNDNCNMSSYFNIYFKEVDQNYEPKLLEEKNTFKKIKLNYDSILSKNTIKYDEEDIIITQNHYKNRFLYNIKFNSFKKEKHYVIFVSFFNNDKTIYSNTILT